MQSKCGAIYIAASGSLLSAELQNDAAYQRRSKLRYSEADDHV